MIILKNINLVVLKTTFTKINNPSFILIIFTYFNLLKKIEIC
jgi:hypothetical protein